MAEPGAKPSNRERAKGWAELLVVTVVLTATLHWVRAPAALLLGPMFAGIAAAARGWNIGVARWLSHASQAIIGCLIAGSMAGALGPVVAQHWLLFLALTIATVAISGGLGYALSRLGVVPGTVAIWGSMPGGATAMVLLADANGADARLVAVMVYTRVVTVTLAASALSIVLGVSAVPTHAIAAVAAAPPWLLPALVGVSLIVAWLMRWRSATLMVAMTLGVLTTFAGMPAVHVPTPLLVLAFAIAGWRVGLSFTGEARAAAIRMFPRVLVAALALVACSGMLAAAMHYALHIDPLTAWLAASPGGLDSAAVIASSLPVDTPFIMAAQAARFAMVMLVGPTLATLLARRTRNAAQQDAA